MTRPHPKVKASPSTSSSPPPHFHSAYAAPMSDLPGRSSDPTQAVQDGKHLSPGAADRQMASSSRVKRSHSPGSPSTSASPGSTAGRLSRASVTDPLLHRRRPSDSTSRTKTHPGRSASPDWNDGGGSSQAADESMIMRRRENNRLAAQRFRNRKKSYQESLEEKVKGLEVERGALLRRLEQGDDSAYPYNRSRSSPTTLHREYYPYPPPVHRSTGRPSSPLTLPDGDLRSASLESANRRLQDQLNTATEENERLRKTLDQWIQYGRSLELERRGGPDALHPGSEQPLGTPGPPVPHSLHRPRLTPPSAQQQSPPAHHRYSYGPPMPQQQQQQQRPPLERSTSSSILSYSPGRGGIQLPPIRLPSHSPSASHPIERATPMSLPSASYYDRQQPPWPPAPEVHRDHRHQRYSSHPRHPL